MNEPNTTLCSCCGQFRPFPTEPGIWEYNEWVTGSQNWIPVEVKYPESADHDGPDGLRLWIDGHMAWWPSHAAWRKIS